jgi:hypothetical protein
MISDRIATTPDLLSTFSLESKCKTLCPYALILYSGSVFNPDLITGIKQQNVENKPTREIAALLANKYKSLHKASVESAVLSRFGFSSFEEFHNKQNYLNPEVAKNITTLITSYNIGIDLLLAGIDSEAHIFHIGELGTFCCYDEPGFRCIGCGQGNRRLGN